MHDQTETAFAQEHLSPWRKLMAWLTAVEAAMNYDPQEELYVVIRRLGKDLKQLETRVLALEVVEKQ